jgi:hypothetical protein
VKPLELERFTSFLRELLPPLSQRRLTGLQTTLHQVLDLKLVLNFQVDAQLDYWGQEMLADS